MRGYHRQDVAWAVGEDAVASADTTKGDPRGASFRNNQSFNVHVIHAEDL